MKLHDLLENAPKPAPASILSKLKSIFSGNELSGPTANLPAVVNKQAVDLSKRSMLKRSVSSTLVQAADMTPLTALVKLIQLEPNIKPYKLTKGRAGEYDINGQWTITDEEIIACKGYEATLKKWQALAKKASSSKQIDDVMAALDATENFAPDLFGGETYNGWMINFDIEDSSFDMSVLTAEDKKLVDNNIFYAKGWSKLSPRAKTELAKAIMDDNDPIEYIWIKCDVVLTLLPLLK